MLIVTTLAELLPGESGVILEEQREQLPQRLLDLGFIAGGKVQCLFSSSAGDPRAYLVRDTVVALRQADTRGVLLEKEAKI